MKAIVMGGTGFLGSHLVEMLSDDGWKVIVFSRSANDFQATPESDVDYRSVDITQLDALEKVFETVDVVFHCAALSSVWGSYECFYQANVEGTRNVLRCCEKFGVGQMIYVSSTSVYFNFKDQTHISETDPVADTFANDYAATKYQGEQVVLNEKEQVKVSIIRPRGIVGDGDKAIMPRILRVAKSGFFPLLKGGNALVDITYVKNVAYALLLCAKTENHDTEIYNISNDQPMKVKTLLLLALKNQSVTFLKLPYGLFYSLASVLEWVQKLRGGSEPRLTRYGVGLLAYTQTLNIDKAKKCLGYTPKYSIEYAIEQYLNWEAGRD